MAGHIGVKKKNSPKLSREESEAVIYPCEKCDRKQTAMCAWRNCTPFRRWFSVKWEQIRIIFKKEEDSDA